MLEVAYTVLVIVFFVVMFIWHSVVSYYASIAPFTTLFVGGAILFAIALYFDVKEGRY